MKFTNIATIVAVSGSLALAGAAGAKDKKHDNDRRWDSRHQTWTPPGLAKKAYKMPPGQAKKLQRYSRGQHLPRTYYSNRTYYISQPTVYRLRTPPPGYQWVRVGNDVYLAQTRTGLIADVIANLIR